MDNLMNMIEELKRIINKIQDMSVNYINNHPIYEKFQNQIETVNKSKFKNLYFRCLLIIIILVVKIVSLQRETVRRNTQTSERNGTCSSY